MVVWATVPYLTWQISYHFLITVRRREKIAAGRPTSFTWLRRSYAKNPLGRIVLSLPEALQEPAFMGIQYAYALLTMLPCPLWFWYRWASATFLMSVFTWATYNGATFYIDVFGRRMEKELEQLKREIRAWQTSPDGSIKAGPEGKSPMLDAIRSEDKPKDGFSLDAPAAVQVAHVKKDSVDSAQSAEDGSTGTKATASATGVSAEAGARKR